MNEIQILSKSAPQRCAYCHGDTGGSMCECGGCHVECATELGECLICDKSYPKMGRCFDCNQQFAWDDPERMNITYRFVANRCSRCAKSAKSRYLNALREEQRASDRHHQTWSEWWINNPVIDILVLVAFVVGFVIIAWLTGSFGG